VPVDPGGGAVRQGPNEPGDRVGFPEILAVGAGRRNVEAARPDAVDRAVACEPQTMFRGDATTIRWNAGNFALADWR
jgi:hypothetical protein